MPPRVLVTRSRHQASELAERLQALGAEPVLIPSIETAEPTSLADLDAALANLNSFHWLLFTSANAVEVFVQRLDRGRALVALPSEPILHKSPVILSEARSAESKDPCISPASKSNAPAISTQSNAPPIADAFTPPHPTPRLAAIGPSTARVLQNHGLTPDLIPPQAVTESLTEALLPHARQPDGTSTRFLLIRAEDAREHLPETLRAAGAEVTVAAAYRTIIPTGSIDLLRTLLSQDRLPNLNGAPHLSDGFTVAKVGEAPREIDAITFTSSSTARNLLALCQAAGVTLPAAALRISIGPITSQTLRDLGLPAHAESPQATIASLAESVMDALRANGSP